MARGGIPPCVSEGTQSFSRPKGRATPLGAHMGWGRSFELNVLPKMTLSMGFLILLRCAFPAHLGPIRSGILKGAEEGAWSVTPMRSRHSQLTMRQPDSSFGFVQPGPGQGLRMDMGLEAPLAILFALPAFPAGSLGCEEWV